MTVEQLRTGHERRPFEPFRINTADGKSYEVPHPEFLSRSPSGRTIAVATPEDAFVVIDLLLVTSLERVNGRAKAPRRRSRG